MREERCERVRGEERDAEEKSQHIKRLDRIWGSKLLLLLLFDIIKKLLTFFINWLTNELDEEIANIFITRY